MLAAHLCGDHAVDEIIDVAETVRFLPAGQGKQFEVRKVRLTTIAPRPSGHGSPYWPLECMPCVGYRAARPFQSRTAEGGLACRGAGGQAYTARAWLGVHWEICSGMRNLRRLMEILGELLVNSQQSRLDAARAVDRLDVLEQRLERVAAGMQRLLARTSASAAETKERGLFNRERLNALGVLNYENPVVSGERRFLRSYFEYYPDALVFDVGANAGHYAELVRELAPKADIYCFEPSPDFVREFSQSVR